jgi:predicted Zn-dependent protease
MLLSLVALLAGLAVAAQDGVEAGSSQDRSEPVVTAAEAEALAQAAAAAKADPGAAAALLRAAVTPSASAALPFASAAYAIQAGREAEAVPDLEDALRRLPGFHRARAILARTLLRLQRPADAAHHLRCLLQDNAPDSAETWRLLAFALLSGGYASAAESAYRQALVWAPDDPEVNAGLLQSLLEQGRSADVIPLVRDQLRRQPTDPRWWRLLANAQLDRDDSDAALVTLECARFAGTADHDMLAVLGDLNLERGAYAEAATAYLAAAAAELPPARLLRAGDALLAAGRTADAARILERLATLTAALDLPARTLLARLRARHAAQEGNSDQAAALLREALALDPLDGEALLLLADLAAAGAPTSAQELLERATTIPSCRLRALTGLAHLAVSQRRYGAALGWLEQALALSPDPRLERYRDQVLEASRSPAL